ncbi:hypothetical protein OC845_001273 [Tilletia horrida]|nr:hypothetical protein OC845_001273 [Tilletia horrida]
MLSSSSHASSGPPIRPRPPGAGRKSKTFAGLAAAPKGQFHPPPSMAPNLDLPADALANNTLPPRASTMPAPFSDRGSNPSSPARQRTLQPSRSRLLNVFGADGTSAWDDADDLGPKPPPLLSRPAPTSDEQFSDLINVALANMASRKKTAENNFDQAGNSATLTPHSGSEALASLGAPDLDAEHIGGLSRTELEGLLVAANRKIIERERDIAIAAQIGRTLVEKHDSIKAKHDGILRALSTTNAQDLTPLVHQHQHHIHHDDEMGMGPPKYTPPNNDGHDYFGPVSSSSTFSAFADTSYTQPQTSRRSTDSANTSLVLSPASKRRSLGGAAAAYMQQQLEDLEVRNDDLYVEVEALRTKAEEDKRKDSERLRNIQREMEALKAELSMAYSRNAELEDIARREDERKQLHGTEAWKKRVQGGPTPAQQRTREWWDEATAQASPIKIVVKRPDSSRRDSHDLSQDDGAVGDMSWDSAKSAGRQRLDEDVGEGLADHVPLPSRDDIAEAGAQDRERVLVAQLLAKVRELEEANAAISARAKEFGDRAGRAFEQGERIKDEYEAVESASRMDLVDEENEVEDAADQSLSSQRSALRLTHADGGELSDLEAHDGTGRAFSGADSSFSLQGQAGDSAISSALLMRRRAPGNRYAIEGRRTLRSAIRRERERAVLAEMMSSQGENTAEFKMPNSISISSISSFNSSLGSLRASSSESSFHNQSRSSADTATALKPRKSALMLGRPKIRITPSCEDMAAAREQEQKQKEGGWEDEENLDPSHVLREQADELQPLGRRQPALPQSRSLRRIASESVINTDSDTDAGNFTVRKKTTVRRRSRLPPTLEQMTPSSSFGSMHFPSTGDSGSVTPQMKAITLGSELGSQFGDIDEEESHFSPFDKHRRSATATASSVASTSNSPLKYRRPRRAQSSMTLAVDAATDDEDALSDIAELRFSGPGSLPKDPSVSQIAGITPATSFNDLNQEVGFYSPLDKRLQFDCSPATDGVWRADEPVVPHAALRDGEMTKYAAYDLLERAADHHPVTWADDEDFGRPITEGEARRLKLLEDGRSQRSVIGFRSTGLLSWLAPTTKRKKRSGMLQQSDNGPTATIQSQEQIDESKQVSVMLRAKRVAALQRAAAAKSGLDYDLSPSAYKTRQAIGSGTALDAHALENEDEVEDELEARALAFSPSSQRRVKRLSLHGLPPSGEELLIPGGIRKRRSNSRLRETALDTYHQHLGPSAGVRNVGAADRMRPTRKHSSLSTYADSEISRDERREEDEGDERSVVGGEDNFELVEVPEHVRRQRSGAAAKGTDYYPVDLYARYKPTMVQNRVKVASNEVVTLISTWALFATVTVFAFVVAFS